MKVYDVFGTIPPPTERDGADIHRRYATIAAGEAKGPGGETYYGYRDDLYHEVEDAFARHGVAVGEHNVELVRGLFEDTIQLDKPVSFAHLDGDWYESTMTCLTRIAPLLATGGRIVLDDYSSGPVAGRRSTSTSPAARASGSSTVRSSTSSVSDSAVKRTRARGAKAARRLLRRRPRASAPKAPPRPPAPAAEAEIPADPRGPLVGQLERGRALDVAVIDEVRTMLAEGTPVARSRSRNRCSAIPGRTRSDGSRRASSPTSAATARSHGRICARFRRPCGRGSRPAEYVRSGLARAPDETLQAVRALVDDDPPDVLAESWYEILAAVFGYGDQDARPAGLRGLRPARQPGRPRLVGGADARTGCGRGSKPTPTRRPLPPRRAGARCSRSWTTGIRARPVPRPTSAITSRASPRSRTSSVTAACDCTATHAGRPARGRSETGRGRSSRATTSKRTSR